MKVLALLLASISLSHSVLGSDPIGDSLKVGEIDTFTHEFELSPDLELKAIAAREKIIDEGRLGVSRTSSDGIVVTLKVEGGYLWVSGIGILEGDGGYTAKPKVLPTDIVSDPVRADWFSGELIGYFGKQLRFHVREFGFVLQVSKGMITSQKQVNLRIE